jgi:hypothetical protein
MKMKTTIVAIVASVLISTYISSLQAQAPQALGKPFEGLVIRNVTVISPERAEALRNGPKSPKHTKSSCPEVISISGSRH